MLHRAVPAPHLEVVHKHEALHHERLRQLDHQLQQIRDTCGGGPRAGARPLGDVGMPGALLIGSVEHSSLVCCARATADSTRVCPAGSGRHASLLTLAGDGRGGHDVDEGTWVAVLPVQSHVQALLVQLEHDLQAGRRAGAGRGCWTKGGGANMPVASANPGHP